jgi:hypothetical protein
MGRGVTSNRRRQECHVEKDERAHAVGDAPGRAFDDILNHDARAHNAWPAPWADPDAPVQGRLGEDEANALSPLEYVSGDEKKYVRQVAAFRRRGPFRVQLARF